MEIKVDVLVALGEHLVEDRQEDISVLQKFLEIVAAGLADSMRLILDEHADLLERIRECKDLNIEVLESLTKMLEE